MTSPPESATRPPAHPGPQSAAALLSVSATVLLWGMHGPVANLLVKRMPWPVVIVVNSAWSVLALLVLCAVTRRLSALRRYTLGQMARLALMGLFGVTAYYGFLYYGFSTVRHAAPLQVLNYLFPVMTVLFSAALVRGERLTARRGVSVLIAFFGAYVVLTRGDLTAFRPESWRGVIAAILAAVSYGMFGTLGKRFRWEPFPGMLVVFAAGGVMATGFLVLAPALGQTLRWPNIMELRGLAFIGIASNCLGTVFWLRALRLGETALVGSVVYLAVFVSVLGFHWLSQEPLPPSILIGVAVLVAGAVLASRPNRRRGAGGSIP